MRSFLTSFICLTLLSGTINAQTLFTYGKDKVTKEEFLRAYNKNKNASVNQSTALREYLDLYIRFKLKVKAAENLRIDTLPNLLAEYQNFKTQIEESYLDDDDAVNDLMNEAFKRSQKDIRVNHLFIPFNSSQPADTLKGYNAALSAQGLINSGQSFQNVVQELSKQGITASHGDLGFVTVFSLPYALENIIYNSKKGETSKMYRARNGYYFFKATEERKAVGKMKAAQILISIPEGANESEKQRALKTADSAYALLKSGANFETLATAISNDKMSYMAGGVMSEFGTGKYSPSFEAEVFNLRKDGDFTKPFLTTFGYHIVKRLSHTPVTSDEKDAANIFYLRQKIQEDSRMQVAREKFTGQLLKKINYKKNPSLDYKQLFAITDSFISGPEDKTAIGMISQRTPVHYFGNNTVRVGDWLKFFRNYKAVAGEYNIGTHAAAYDKFVAQSALDYYRKNLEQLNPEFRFQVQEFKDGNMLFEIMERKVWNRASTDSIGLLNYYNKNGSKYIWEPSADAILISAATAKLAAESAEKIRQGQQWRDVVGGNPSQLQFDSGRYELSQIPVVDRTNFQNGLVTAPLTNESDGTASFAVILKMYPGNQQRSFEESRGLVINDYQLLLENQWIEELKKKYPVKIDEKVFSSLLK